MRFDDADLAELSDAVNASVRRGDFTLLDTGANAYRVALPGLRDDLAFGFTLIERAFFYPLGFALVRLNALEYERATLSWNDARQALVLQLDIRDKLDGIVADARLLGRPEERLEFAVLSGRFTYFLTPRIGFDGRIEFAPIELEIDVNTDDAIPEVREPLRDALRDVEADIERQLNEQFEPYGDALADWTLDRLAPGAKLRRITITDRLATLEAEPGASAEDVTGDGIVDIRDLVIVARDFGRVGFSQGDINDDGVVDIRDLVRIALRFGR